MIPAPHRVGHRAATTGPAGTDLGGNPKPGGYAATATTRRAQAIYRRGTDVPVSGDYLDRHVNELTVLLPHYDGKHFRNGDIMMLFGVANSDGTYTGGTAYIVDGDPADWSLGPGTPRVGVQVDVKRVAGAKGVVA